MAKKSSKKQSVASRIADEERVPIANLVKAQRKISQKAKVATTTPAGAGGKTLPVGKVGWNEENPLTPIVLLDKKTRAELGLEIGSLVSVSKGKKKEVAIVQLQFWEFVGTGKCTLNTKLGKLLDVAVEGKVVIDKDVSEKQKQAFAQALMSERGRMLAQVLGRVMRDAQSGENPEE